MQPKSKKEHLIRARFIEYKNSFVDKNKATSTNFVVILHLDYSK